jgi:hypothetical protein
MNRLRALGLTAFVVVACGGPQKLGGNGATCFRDDDCQAGFICVAPSEGDTRRVCSNDPTSLVSMVEGPPAAAGSGGAVTAGAGGVAGSANAGGKATGGYAGKPSSAGSDGGGMDTGGTATSTPDGGAAP